MQRSARNPLSLRVPLQGWLRAHLAQGTAASLVDLRASDANGMSSTTLLLGIEFADGHAEQLVARLCPSPAEVPVFPHYDLGGQFRVLRLVRELDAAPVPQALWYEPDATVLGVPFLVMRHVDGRVPPDLLPYTCGANWLFDADHAQRQRLQQRTIDVLAGLHGVDAAAQRFAFLDPPRSGESPLRRHLQRTRDWYAFVVANGLRSRLLEACFDWLERNFPEPEPAPVLCWGDARIGNVIYAGFEPVALLDWEMAAIGPRELDVAWLAYAHRVFQDLALDLGGPGLADFLRTADVADSYQRASGYQLREFDFYLAYAAVQWGIVLLRTGQRMVHFGERGMPADPDELMLHRAHLRELVDGQRWPQRLGA